ISRQRTEPVALVDVLRAAVSEIEHYERVKPNIQAGIAVRGHAVSDVVHLLAELAENATAFSPAETMVNVSGYLLNSGGALVDLTDQGVGMDAEELAEANWRLDHPPVVDVAVSRRMGLFVVARLAARHGIRVRLQPAAMGGLTALVWLPDEIITHSTTLTTRWIGTGPPNGETDERTAAAQAVAAARSRFSGLPHPEALTGAAADPGVVLAAPAAEVTDSAPAAEAAATVPAPASAPAVPAPASALTDGAAVAAALADAGPEERLPIFESVESDWFRRGKHSADHAPARGSWSSPADAGWRAAEVADAPVSAGHTPSGLPRRQPGANLVPGGIGQSPLAPPPPARTPAQTRDRMSSFQQGIRRARANSPGDESYPADAADGN
ncbi:MAG TPA: ATP-binding protein, partial [Streptosporangiaceae bacterium]|nr:ATP-binding protein [Streptosporangiaceae bacterium]